MANSNQAKKRVRQNETARQRNVSVRSLLKTLVKRVIEAVDLKDKDLASNSFVRVQKHLDRNASRGLLHKNKAARLKSRLNNLMKSLA